MCFWDFPSIFIIMRIISGIYQIVNQKNGKIYIGSSKNIIRRWYFHKYALRHNRHHCIHLQRSWNKHGEPIFKFEILKEMDRPTEEQLLVEELKVINEHLPQYNIGPVGGGDNLTNHPNREDIIRRIVASIKERVSKMSEEERKRIWGHNGNTNFNWKGGISVCHCIDCKCEIWYGHTRCMACSKQGEQNPFYGKHHTDEHRRKASELRKGKLPTNSNPIVLDGVSYVSQADAARKLGVSIGSISNWVRGKFKRRLAS
jgi:group I intron endonuclease